MTADGFSPATEADLPLIQDCIRRFRLDGENLAAAQFTVLREEGRIVAFGRVKPYTEVAELGSVGVLEEDRGKGHGECIVRELIRRFPDDDVYVTTDLRRYFERFGFQVIDPAPPELISKIDRICGTLRSGVVAMHLRR